MQSIMHRFDLNGVGAEASGCKGLQAAICDHGHGYRDLRWHRCGLLCPQRVLVKPHAKRLGLHGLAQHRYVLVGA